MPVLVRNTLFQVRYVQPDSRDQRSRFIVVFQDLDHLGEVLFRLVVSSLISFEPAGDINLQTGDIGNDVNGAAASDCDCPFHLNASF